MTSAVTGQDMRSLAFAGAAGVDALLIQTDGKIVAVGAQLDPQNRNIEDLVIARYLGN
jgi:hypothetical protein